MPKFIITEEFLSRVLKAVEECMFGTATTGFCLACGEDQEGCEPDLRNGKCHSCGVHKVFGAEEVMISFM